MEVTIITVLNGQISRKKWAQRYSYGQMARSLGAATRPEYWHISAQTPPASGLVSKMLPPMRVQSVFAPQTAPSTRVNSLAVATEDGCCCGRLDSQSRS